MMRNPIRRSNKTSKHKQKGVVAIEFAVGFTAFWLMCMMWVEMSYMSYVSAICDVTIAQAARVAKKENLDPPPDSGSDATDPMYLAKFKTALSNDKSIWGKFVDPSKFHASVKYLNDIDDLVNLEEACKDDEEDETKKCEAANNNAIAIYRVTYNFNPTLNFFLDKDTVFTREVIVVQENERSEFES